MTQSKIAGEFKDRFESQMTRTGRGGNRPTIRSGRIVVVTLTAILELLALTASALPQTASDGKLSGQAGEAGKRRVIPVTINKGETYTISGLEEGAKADSKAVKNPNALSIQPQPSGDIVLLGTEAGSWKINATLINGEKVTFDVKVKAAAPPINSLSPGWAPTAIAP